ncbi:UDP-N-acetylmuramate dehydrogenase [Pseudodesulfovibrio sediminis]|uniref:UDP-N-acetylenolpyruvoylglucosamine reductase n=1 Tax=Pseudodesulfovibrio sediminis TaxID=2810563 RepID=A0ABM7P632_9BACT|nr:UDP-N-acetylmuramate dehydrogenase [Pseudodesulfovibrio sediminis]BCS88356.1 UDP-N-acetylenolpyruvoylglucosamine reductase [Pseudodesulfovibrio sediminis]
MSLEFITNPSLSERTSLKLGGNAEVEVIVREKQDLDELGDFLMTETLRPFVIGEGTNLLAPDGQLDLALIRVATPPGPQRVEKINDALIVRCGASQRLSGLLGWAQMAGLSGLEGLTGIPGSVGGSVAMNAGSYGTEMSNLVTRIRLWSPGQGLIWLDHDQCDFGYRHFAPKQGIGKCLVWQVELKLTESNPKAVRKAMQDNYNKKKATQPVTARSAGCVFKNPEGQSAGILLDQAGMKGVRLGGVGFSDIHANFLVNLDNGTSADALVLIEQGREAVKEKFDITLDTEVIIL